MVFHRVFASSAISLCLFSAPAAANQRLPLFTYDDIAQTLTLLDSTGSPVQIGTVNTSTHTIALAVGGGIASVPNGGTGATSFTANAPLIGAGSSALGQGTRSGNTTSFATSNGALTSGHCVQIDASGNFVDAGGVCTVGGGGGTVTSSAINTLAYFAAAGTVVTGLATANNKVLTTGGTGVPTWATTLPCANNSASTGDITGTAGTCSNTVTGIQGTTVGSPTGTAGSAVVLQTSPAITTPTITSSTDNQPTINQPVIMGDVTTAGGAAAGQVGEILTNNATIGISTATATSVTSQSITAGHWSCSGGATINPAGTTTVQAWAASVSTTNNTHGGIPGSYTSQSTGATGQIEAASFGPRAFDFTSTTTVYIVVTANFGVSTMNTSANLLCRRVW